MTRRISSTLTMHSEVRPDGTLELTLKTVPLDEPSADEVVVEIRAAPLHPADIGLLLGPADLSSAHRTGQGQETKMVFRIPPERLGALSSRTGKSLPIGNEGAGVVIAAGGLYSGLIGKPVAVMGGAMISRYRIVKGGDCLLLPTGCSIPQGAAALINPLTALTMIETMRAEGHVALVHTAAASSLGQMLNRICIQDRIPLVSIVRKREQAALLIGQGAQHVCDSSGPTFIEDLNAHVAATRSTLAFDAVGGGPLAGQILSAMERSCSALPTEYSRYGSSIYKKVYFYGGLNTGATQLDRSYGMAWGVGGWLVFDKLTQMTPDTLTSLRTRICSELQTTFSTEFTGELSMTDALELDNIMAFAERRTGAKWLINPQRPLG
jgi:NADPH2:quinone reductase